MQNHTVTDCKQRYTTFWLYSFKQGRGIMEEGGKQSKSLKILFHFIFRRASGRPLPLPNLLFLLHEKEVVLSKGTLVRILCPKDYYANYQNKHVSNIVMW